jgi:hypothetical protein
VRIIDCAVPSQIFVSLEPNEFDVGVGVVGNLAQVLTVFIKVEVSIKHDTFARPQQFARAVVEMGIQECTLQGRVSRPIEHSLSFVVSPDVFGIRRTANNLCHGRFARPWIPHKNVKRSHV